MEATSALRARADAGDADAQFRLGYRLAFGRTRPRNGRRLAVEYWRQASAKGHDRALFYLGVSYDFGEGAL